MLNIDWGLIQLQYELFGATPEELAEEYNTTPRMIKYAAEERGWQRKPLAVSCQDYSQLTTTDKVTDKLLDEVHKKLYVMRSLKQSALGPRYIALETALLGKCLDFLKNLQPDDPNNAAVLKQVSEVLKSLNELTHGKATQDDPTERRGLQINILNKVESTKDSKEEITVEVAGQPVSKIADA